MGPADFIAIGIILVVVGCAVAYIVKAKKSGKKCIGCPDSASCSAGGCSGKCSSCSCGCGKDDADTDAE